MNREQVRRLLESEVVPRGKLLRMMGVPTARAMSALPLEEPLLSTLANTEKAVITFRYCTCVTTEAFRLELRGPVPVALVAYELHPFRGAAPIRCLGRKRLGALSLRKLDRAIAFYRSGRRGYCTAGTTLTISWARKSGRRRESHHDNTMALSSKRYRDVISFEELLGRLLDP